MLPFGDNSSIADFITPEFWHFQRWLSHKLWTRELEFNSLENNDQIICFKSRDFFKNITTKPDSKFGHRPKSGLRWKYSRDLTFRQLIHVFNCTIGILLEIFYFILDINKFISHSRQEKQSSWYHAWSTHELLVLAYLKHIFKHSFQNSKRLGMF